MLNRQVACFTASAAQRTHLPAGKTPTYAKRECVFFLPGGGEGNPEQAAFARENTTSGADLPAFYFDPRDPGSIRVTLPDLADRAADRILAAAQAADIVLIGYSFGGVLGFLTAGRLVQRGARVTKLIMIDSSAPGCWTGLHDVESCRTKWQKLVHFVRLPAWNKGLRVGFQLRNVLNDERYGRMAATLARSGLLANRSRFVTGFREAVMMWWHDAIVRDWSVTPSLEPLNTVPVYLLRSQDSANARPDLGWSTFCPSVQVVPLEGDHTSIFEDANRHVVNAHVAALLRQ